MLTSPPRAQTKALLRFRNVWLTLNKTMLCFYTSCFSVEPPSRNAKPWQAGICVCTAAGPAETGRHWTAHRPSPGSQLSSIQFLSVLPDRTQCTSCTYQPIAHCPPANSDKQILLTLRHTNHPFVPHFWQHTVRLL